MDLSKLHSNLKQLDVVDIMVDSLEDIDEFIADLNRTQLTQGLRDDGSSIEPEYSALTEVLKRSKSGTAGITSNVTLFDTGQFHKSIFTSIFPDEIVLDSKDSKLNKLEDKYQSILGLTEASIKKLKQKVLPIFWRKFNEQLYK